MDGQVSMTWGFQDTAPSPDEVRRVAERPGRRLLLPAFVWWRNGYSIDDDAFVAGWWAFGIGLMGARLGGHGFVWRLTWGWTSLRRTTATVEVEA